MVAYNAIRNEYLLVYEDTAIAKIVAQRVGRTGEPIGSEFSVSDSYPGNSPALPAVAIDSNNGRYLVVWEDHGNDGDIKGAFVSGTGTVLSTPGVFSISGEQTSTGQPHLDFDWNNDQFLVAWQYGSGIGYQFVDSSTGSLGDLKLSSTGSISGSYSHPQVAFGPDANGDQFALMWDNSPVFGRIVPSDGSTPTATDAFDDGDCGSYPALAYNPDAEEFLVVFQGCETYIYAQRMDTEGGALDQGPDRVASNTYASDATQPRVVYDAQREEFLVAWYDLRQGNDVFANVVSSSGSVDDESDFLLFSLWDDDEGESIVHALAYNSQCANFLSSVKADPADDTADIFNTVYLPCRGATVSTPLALTTELGSTTSVSLVLDTAPTADVTIGLTSSDTGEGTVSAASVTFTTSNWNTPQSVVVTGVDDSEEDGHQEYTIVTAAATSTDAAYNGYDPPDVTITNADDDSVPLIIPVLTFTEEAPTGVDPATGEGGTAFTFSVDYTSSLDKEPAIGELWIDLDGDGAYNTLAPETTALHGPPASPRSGGWPAGGWAAVGALLAVLLVVVGRVASRPVVAGASVVIGVALLAALLSCTSGSGGDEATPTEQQPTGEDGGPGTSQPTGIQEVFQLTASQLNDGDYTNGETYEVALTIDDAGSYTFRFVFYDDTFPAYGLPTAEQTLTVQ